MPHALTAALVVLSVFAIAFTVRRYQAATPEQRPPIVWAACGAVAVACGLGFLFGLR